MASIVYGSYHQPFISSLENIDSTDILLHLPKVRVIQAEQRAYEDFAYHLVGYEGDGLTLVLRQDLFESSGRPVSYISKAFPSGEGEPVQMPLTIQLAIPLRCLLVGKALPVPIIYVYQAFQRFNRYAKGARQGLCCGKSSFERASIDGRYGPTTGYPIRRRLSLPYADFVKLYILTASESLSASLVPLRFAMPHQNDTRQLSPSKSRGRFETCPYGWFVLF